MRGLRVQQIQHRMKTIQQKKVKKRLALPFSSYLSFPLFPFSDGRNVKEGNKYNN